MRGVSSSDVEVKPLERGRWTLQKALAAVGFEPR
jgi:hypothetical protein